MPELLETIGLGTGTGPISYALTELGTVEVESAFAAFDGTGASGPWRPALTVRAQNGAILSRTFPSQELAVGDAAVVTYSPFVPVDSAAAPPPSGGGIDLARELGLVAWTFDPADASTSIRTLGTTIISAVALLAGDVVTTIAVNVVSPSVPAPTHAYTAIYNSSFSRVALSNDTPACGTSVGWNATTLSSPYTVPSDGYYYVGACWDVTGSAPTQAAVQGSGTIGGLVLPTGTYRTASTAAAITSFPATWTGTALVAQTPILLLY